MRGARPGHLILSLLFLGAVCLSCRYRGNLWGDVHNFRGCEWKSGEKITFTPDTFSIQGKSPTEIVLLLRYGEGMNFSRLPLLMEVESPDDDAGYYSDTLTLELGEYGSGGSGRRQLHGLTEICDTIHLQRPVCPGWTISFSPAYENMDIRDIYSIGLTIMH